jgi:hypothetical protein
MEKKIAGKNITDISYFKDKFKQLGFRTFYDNKQMHKFLERVFKSEDGLNSFINDRYIELDNQIELKN